MEFDHPALVFSSYLVRGIALFPRLVYFSGFRSFALALVVASFRRLHGTLLVLLLLVSATGVGVLSTVSRVLLLGFGTFLRESGVVRLAVPSCISPVIAVLESVVYLVVRSLFLLVRFDLVLRAGSLVVAAFQTVQLLNE